MTPRPVQVCGKTKKISRPTAPTRFSIRLRSTAKKIETRALLRLRPRAMPKKKIVVTDKKKKRVVTDKKKKTVVTDNVRTRKILPPHHPHPIPYCDPTCQYCKLATQPYPIPSLLCCHDKLESHGYQKMLLVSLILITLIAHPLAIRTQVRNVFYLRFSTSVRITGGALLKLLQSFTAAGVRCVGTSMPAVYGDTSSLRTSSGMVCVVGSFLI